MKYWLSTHAALKALESPSVYDIGKDELYELDEEGFSFLAGCASAEGSDAAGADPYFAAYCLSEGLLTTEQTLVRRPPVIKTGRPSLRYLELQITDKCNLRCRHCFLGGARGLELSLPDLEKTLGEFEAAQGLRLMITGGEPLMHSRFRDFNELLPAYAFRKILFSNGALVTRDLIRRLHVDEIQFSVDGMERGHDFLRGRGSFTVVMKAVREALELGMPVSVATMIHKGNLEEFGEMETLFRSMGVKDWTVDAPSMAADQADNGSICVPPETGGRLLRYGFGGGMHGSGEGAGCGYHLASVLANGDICKCAFYSDMPAGNIGGGLAAAWARIEPVSLGALRCAEISCPVLSECRGGCRYRASVSGGGSARPGTAKGYGHECDLYKCRYYGILETGMKPCSGLRKLP
jgi:radical SAM protein with 4Fe4S-binding SPASM domain